MNLFKTAAFGLICSWAILISTTPKIAQAQEKNSRLPPQVLFHIGQQRYLLENDREGNIPQVAWDRFIMGGESRYGLVPYRRGLYGGERFDSLELYGNLYVATPNVPWVMAIEIREECRSPEAVSSIFEDPRYHRWLVEHINELLNAPNGSCINPHATGCRDIFLTNPVANGGTASACDQFIDRFLLENGIKIVFDSEWPDSWYIRDRSCIKSIRARAPDVLRILSDSAWDHESRVTTYSGSNGYGMSSFLMLVGALADAESADVEILARLRSVTSQSNILFSVTTNPTRNLAWIRESGPAAIDAYLRCVRSNNFSAFRDRAREFAVRMQTPDMGGDYPFMIGGLDYAEQMTNDLYNLCN